MVSEDTMNLQHRVKELRSESLVPSACVARQ